ncbi:MAG: response regulator, partial [Deltaproteobacteria bacterium]|nr:response regulator [Deltaproteobacteria bacterium]
MTEKKRKIMLVDDDADFVWLTSRMLEGADYQVLEARNGEEGLRCFHKETPDLVLMDYRLPGEDGLKTSLRMMKCRPGIPIVIISGFAEIRTAVSALKAGVYDYVTKPLNPDDFLFTIRRVLEKRALEKEVRHLRKELNS